MFLNLFLFVAQDCRSASTPLKSGIRIYRRLTADAKDSSAPVYSGGQRRPTAIDMLMGTNGDRSDDACGLKAACSDVKSQNIGRVCSMDDEVKLGDKEMVSVSNEYLRSVSLPFIFYFVWFVFLVCVYYVYLYMGQVPELKLMMMMIKTRK